MNILKKYGPWACVAGAAEGLGAAFSLGLAIRGFNLILIDNQNEELDMLREKLLKIHKIEVIALHLDLSSTNCTKSIMAKLVEKNCRFLVYNAAYGPVKPFLSNTDEELDVYLNVNAVTPIHLAYNFATHFQNQKAGIMLVSSLAGFRGTQYVVPYAATKAFTWNLAEGLHYEFKESGLNISVCCPGPVDTPNYRSTNPKPSFITPKSMNPGQVAEESLDQFGKKLFIFPGFSNKFAHFILNHILPRKIASGIHNATMKKMYGF